MANGDKVASTRGAFALPAKGDTTPGGLCPTGGWAYTGGRVSACKAIGRAHGRLRPVGRSMASRGWSCTKARGSSWARKGRQPKTVVPRPAECHALTPFAGRATASGDGSGAKGRPRGVALSTFLAPGDLARAQRQAAGRDTTANKGPALPRRRNPRFTSVAPQPAGCGAKGKTSSVQRSAKGLEARRPSRGCRNWAHAGGGRQGEEGDHPIPHGLSALEASAPPADGTDR